MKTTTTTTTSSDWLQIDIKGFAQTLSDKGTPRILLEPISNALDPNNVTEVSIEFEQANGRATLVVTDDDPEGFENLADAYTLYAPSTRKADPTKRGRFGQGEKELLALCFDGGTVSVSSTKGTIVFDRDGRRADPAKRTAGTELRAAEFKCNQKQAKEFVALVQMLLIPAEVKVTLNGEALRQRPIIETVTVSLPTKLADVDGNIIDGWRQTDVELYDLLPGEKAHIYELGIPVVDHDGRWHCNVMQKVPLNRDRDNVNPAYLRRLRELMLNATHDRLTEVDMKKSWVVDALPKATPEAFRDAVERVHGKDAVIYDPSNKEASKRALDDGRTVIYSRQFSPESWARIRGEDGGEPIFRPAGQVIETGIPTSADGKPPIPQEDWTAAMYALAEYVQAAGKHTIGFAPNVDFANQPVASVAGHAAAWWGGRTVTFNLGRLGMRWPETASQASVDELVIHEFAHHFAADHFSDEMIRSTCRIGAKLRTCPAFLNGAGGREGADG